MRRRGIVDFVTNGGNEIVDSSGGTASSTSYASDILRQLQNSRRSSSNDTVVCTPKFGYETEKRRRGFDVAPSTTMKEDDDDANESALIADGQADRTTMSPRNAGRRRIVRRPVFADMAKLRANVSMLDHLDRLQFVLNWCDMYEKGKWFGIKRFVDCYFSLVFKPYLGDFYNLNVIHVAKMRKVCAVCILSPEERLCTFLVMLNYPLWDRLLRVSASLPTRYFRKSPRQRLIDCETTARESAPTDNDNNEFNDSESSEAYNVSLAALCLIDRLEYSMQTDLHNSHLDHVVTLSPFLANSYEARQVFRTNLVFE